LLNIYVLAFQQHQELYHLAKYDGIWYYHLNKLLIYKKKKKKKKKKLLVSWFVKEKILVY